VQLKTWKTAKHVQKTKTNSVGTLRDDRALFARLRVVLPARPELDLKESIGEFEFVVYPRSLFTVDGHLRPCTAKSKLMTMLEATTPPAPIVKSTVQPLQHGRVTIIVQLYNQGENPRG
jgi:hypothetical protein